MKDSWYKIGLTGGIASGKSTVSRWLSDKGVPIVDADIVARQVVSPGSPGLQALVDVFGSSIVAADGALDRTALGTIVFSDDQKRSQLNALLHGRIRDEMHRQAQQWANNGYHAVVYDVPLLIETGLYQTMDTVWLVYVDSDTQLQRLMARDGWSKEEALQRMASQMPMNDKRKYAQRIIDNTKGIEDLEAQLVQLWEEEHQRFLRT